jgi:AbrB family looped-hinge helix DNA binding protein
VIAVETTRLSSKGQIIIPQGIREAHHWKAGLEFNVIDTEQGILLTPRLPFKATSIKEIRGCVNYKGKKKTLREMEEGIAKGAKEK